MLLCSFTTGTKLMIISYILVFLIGVTVFSYLNLVIEGLPKKKGIFDKHSSCPKCGHKLKISESLPIVSYIASKGKCHYCFEKLGIRRTIIEILGGFIGLLVMYFFGVTLMSLVVFLGASVLTVIIFVVIDIKKNKHSASEEEHVEEENS